MPQVAGHGQLAAPAQSEAVDGGDDGFIQLFDATEDGGSQLAEGAALDGREGAHFGDVGTRDEGPAFAREDDDADGVIVGGGTEGVVEFP